MRSLYLPKPNIIEKWKWREFTRKLYTSSSHLYNDRFLPYIDIDNSSNVFLLDLLRMKTKKFVVQWDTEPNALINDFSFKVQRLGNWNILSDFHTLVAEVMYFTNNGERLMDIVVLHLDYEKSIATFKQPRILLDRRSTTLVLHSFNTTDEPVCVGAIGHSSTIAKNISVCKVSCSNDDCIDISTIQRLEFPKQFCFIGVLNNNLYGFWKEDCDKSNVSNLVQVCLKTKERTTLKVRGWPTNLKCKNNGYKWAWIDQILVMTVIKERGNKTHMFALRFDSMRWYKLKFKFDTHVTNLLSNYKNTLVVETMNPWNVRRYYRFNFKRPHTLVNLLIHAMKQRTLQNAIEYVPNQFKLPAH